MPVVGVNSCGVRPHKLREQRRLIKEALEAGDIAMPRCCDERVEKTPLLDRIHGHPSALGDVLPGASHYLTRVGLFKPKEFRDVAVGIAEGLS
jgi:hypothetical protein